MALVMERLVLDNAVGPGCKNTKADVLRLQFALNTIAPAWGGPESPLPFDGKYDKRVSVALQRLQVHCFSKSRKASGKIEPNDKTHGKINQVLAGAVDLVAVTSHGGRAVEIGANAFATEIRFNGLSQLVAKVQEALEAKPADPSFSSTAQQKKLAHLTISSHGSPGYMQLSNSTVEEDLILAQYQFDDVVNYGPEELAYGQATRLGSLKGKFVRWGLVTLSACRVAGPRNEIDKKTKKKLYSIDGRNFLKAISQALGNIAVQGGTLKQNDADFGMEGPCYRCDAHCCTLVTPQTSNFFGPDFSVTDEFGAHHLEDTLAENTLAAVANLPTQHPEKQGLLKKLFNRKRKS
jgi:hypothetical protein